MREKSFDPEMIAAYQAMAKATGKLAAIDYLKNPGPRNLWNIYHRLKDIYPEAELRQIARTSLLENLSRSK